MKLLVLFMASFLLAVPSCNFTLKVPLALSPEEKSFIENLKSTFRAEKIEVLPVGEDDSIVPHSINIVIINSKNIKYDNPEAKVYSSLILDSLLLCNKYVKVYKVVKVTFEQRLSWNFFPNSVFTSYLFREPAIDEKIAEHESPLQKLETRITDLRYKRDYSSLMSLADSIADLNPDYAELSEQTKGIIYLDTNDTLQALKHFLKARLLWPNNSNNFLNLSVLYTHMSNCKMAISYIDSAILMEPKNGEFYFQRSRLEHQIGQDNWACSDARKSGALGYPGASQLILVFCKD